MAEHESKSEGKEKDPAKTRVDNTLHQDVHSFARAAEAGLKHREADLHTKDQKCSKQRPDRVDGIDDIVALQFSVGGIRAQTKDIRKEHNAGYYQCNSGELSAKQQATVSPPLRVSQALAQA